MYLDHHLSSNILNCIIWVILIIEYLRIPPKGWTSRGGFHLAEETRYWKPHRCPDTNDRYIVHSIQTAHVHALHNFTSTFNNSIIEYSFYYNGMYTIMSSHSSLRPFHGLLIAKSEGCTHKSIFLCLCYYLEGTLKSTSSCTTILDCNKTVLYIPNFRPLSIIRE